MSNYFKNKLKDRLTYCREWKDSIDLYLANKEITKKADEEYYKTRPFLKFVLDEKIFLPKALTSSWNTLYFGNAELKPNILVIIINWYLKQFIKGKTLNKKY